MVSAEQLAKIANGVKHASAISNQMRGLSAATQAAAVAPRVNAPRRVNGGGGSNMMLWGILVCILCMSISATLAYVASQKNKTSDK